MMRYIYIWYIYTDDTSSHCNYMRDHKRKLPSWAPTICKTLEDIYIIYTYTYIYIYIYIWAVTICKTLEDIYNKEFFFKLLVCFLIYLFACARSWLWHTEYSLRNEESLVLAFELLVVACQNLVPWPGIKLRPPALGAWSLSHWTMTEVAKLLDFEMICCRAIDNWNSG